MIDIMGYWVQLDEKFFGNHRKESLRILKLIWTNLDALFVKNTVESPNVRTFQLETATVHIGRVKGSMLIWIPFLPFTVLHETLHFLIGVFTGNHRLIQYIPPIIDLFYLPLAIVLLAQKHLVLGVFFELLFVSKLLSNLYGDFKPLRASKIEEADSPH